MIPAHASHAADHGVIRCQSGVEQHGSDQDGVIDATSIVDNTKGPLTTMVSDPLRAGDRIRTGDVQLGKLAFYH